MAKDGNGLVILGLRAHGDIDPGIELDRLQAARGNRGVQAQQTLTGSGPVETALTDEEAPDLCLQGQRDAQHEYEPGNEV